MDDPTGIKKRVYQVAMKTMRYLEQRGLQLLMELIDPSFLFLTTTGLPVESDLKKMDI